MGEFSILSTGECDLACHARNIGFLGGINPANDFEGRDRQIVETYWSEGNRAYIIRKRKEDRPYDRIATLSLRWVSEVLPEELKLSKEQLLRDRDLEGALAVVYRTLAILSLHRKTAICRGISGDFLYDINQHINLSSAIQRECKFRDELIKLAEEADETAEAA